MKLTRIARLLFGRKRQGALVHRSCHPQPDGCAQRRRSTQDPVQCRGPPKFDARSSNTSWLFAGRSAAVGRSVSVGSVPPAGPRTRTGPRTRLARGFHDRSPQQSQCHRRADALRASQRPALNLAFPKSPAPHHRAAVQANAEIYPTRPVSVRLVNFGEASDKRF